MVSSSSCSSSVLPGSNSPGCTLPRYEIVSKEFYIQSLTFARSQINPLRTRTNANSVSTTSNWLFNFAVVQFTPVLLDASAWGCFLMFAVINLLFIPVIYFFVSPLSDRRSSLLRRSR